MSMADSLFNSGRLFVLSRRGGRYGNRELVQDTDEDPVTVDSTRSSEETSSSPVETTPTSSRDLHGHQDVELGEGTEATSAFPSTRRDDPIVAGQSEGSSGISMIPPAASILLPTVPPSFMPSTSSARSSIRFHPVQTDPETLRNPRNEGGARLTLPQLNLAELEEERELARRRTSACVMLAIFVFFRLWIEAISRGDFGLLLLCLMGTSWTARWIRHNREREEELDRRIQEYMERGNNGSSRDENATGVFGIERDNLRMLSFQAQLALAIMESQRQMMEGGFGHPDGHQAAAAGVSEEARSRWKRFVYTEDEPQGPVKGGYGSVAQEESTKKVEDVPHCSICLGEYEVGESLVQLPCTHVYHDECLQAWTSNHVKCPLCNFDLQSVTEATSVATSRADSIV